jgi:hypothetical protein
MAGVARLEMYAARLTSFSRTYPRAADVHLDADDNAVPAL